MPCVRWPPCGSARPMIVSPGLEQRVEDGGVGLRAGVRLDVGVLGAEELLGAVDRELLDDVDVLAAAVVAPARDSPRRTCSSARCPGAPGRPAARSSPRRSSRACAAGARARRAAHRRLGDPSGGVVTSTRRPGRCESPGGEVGAVAGSPGSISRGACGRIHAEVADRSSWRATSPPTSDRSGSSRAIGIDAPRRRREPRPSRSGCGRRRLVRVSARDGSSRRVDGPVPAATPRPRVRATADGAAASCRRVEAARRPPRSRSRGSCDARRTPCGGPGTCMAPVGARVNPAATGRPRPATSVERRARQAGPSVRMRRSGTRTPARRQSEPAGRAIVAGEIGSGR